jgi:hypothetical protein
MPSTLWQFGGGIEGTQRHRKKANQQPTSDGLY